MNILHPSNPSQRNSERGSIVVEFALVLPILLLIVGGIVGFGSYFVTQAAISDVADVIATACTQTIPLPAAGTDFNGCANTVINQLRNRPGVYFGCAGGGASIRVRAINTSNFAGNPRLRIMNVNLECNTEPAMWSLAAFMFPNYIRQIRGSTTRAYLVQP